ncbi:MAG: hypothetical protein JKX84_06605 [Flavobacteriales bacterium]|nr:hypothetical protein [Flavobacteriales bacterium]
MMKRFPWHTVLISIYTVLFMYAENLGQVESEDLWMPLGLVLLIGCAAYAVSYLILRTPTKAAIAATIMVLLFFSYGHYHDLFFLPNKEVLNSRFKYDFYIWTSLILCGLMLIGLFRTKSDLSKPNNLLNFMALLLIAMPLYTIIADSFFTKHQTIEFNTEVSTETLQLENRPSIYYLIMDAYGRNDILKEYYDYDNSDFTDALTEIGFYVADKSFANYNKTILSLPSSLNMMYLDSLSAEMGVDSKNESPLKMLIDENRVVKELRRFDYSVATFDAQFLHYLFMDSTDTIFNTTDAGLNLFQVELFNQSIMRAFEKGAATADKLNKYDLHRKTILNAFDKITEVSTFDQPFYVHGHILSPHQPFVFNEKGESVTPKHNYSLWKPIEEGRDPGEYRKEYIAQLRFINSKLIETVKSILKNSKTPPIIIIQGDHGPCAELTSTTTIEGNNFKERMPILNAYYFPNQVYDGLYPGISPVNSFRQILTQYFGLDYPLLPDSSYYSTWTHQYDFVNVTDSITQFP